MVSVCAQNLLVKIMIMAKVMEFKGFASVRNIANVEGLTNDFSFQLL